MRALYEYHCKPCDRDFEEIGSYESRDSFQCPSCGSQCVRRVSLFNFKLYNPFTKDGEGFTSKVVSKQEASERNKANAGKYD